ncbi:MAG: undecaprenyldiphospho-muramoylpentapeptide beta-N-acetylglucosaminyltransferase [Bacteroidales bacterium]|nr:undecaprenyldiphospho-muramoylpentapeptide beta-N-acetylglucosaminyltransferase [Bacteroidales bacterium]
MKAIISGGGSGGHIFPALAIANAIRARHPEAQLLFVGAEGRMEMEKVPAAGYQIKGLPIAGLQRQLTLENLFKNLQLPYRVLRSRHMVRGIIRQFDPDIVIGVGGFASEPTLKVAARMGYTTLLQEQNSYAGLTNKTLARSAATICVAYEGMERFFPADKIVFTGNPVRADIEQMTATRPEGCAAFELDANLPVLLSVGGSLGARSINRMILQNLTLFRDKGLQILWQTGRWMYDEAVEAVRSAGLQQWVKVHQFISRMDLAYAAADVIVSRAGAIAISELCLVGKPVILIPSPNVAEDHQTRNALALVGKGAALMVRDDQCATQGLPLVLDLLRDPQQCEDMGRAIRNLAVTHAAEKIVDEIDKLVKNS